MEKTVSVVIPAKNEEETIGKVLEDLFREINKIKDYSFEVIVVDDKSTDKTADICSKYDVRIVRNNGISGKGKALALGFKESKNNIIVMLDADYSHRPEDLIKFLREIEKGAGLVIGSRSLGGSDEYTPLRTFGNMFLTSVFTLFFGLKLTDSLNGYKVFRKEVVKNHKIRSKDFEVEIEIIANTLREKLPVKEVPSHERKRAGGKMKSNAFIHGSKFLFRIIKEGLKYRLKIPG